MTMARTPTGPPRRRRLLPLFGLALLLPLLRSAPARAQGSLSVDIRDTRPSSQESLACAGTNARLVVDVSGGTGVYAYQWSRQRKGETSFTDIDGATSALLIIDFVTRDQDGDLYQVVVTDSAGALGSDVTKLVVLPLAIPRCPDGRSVSIQCGMAPVPDFTSGFYFCGNGTVTQTPPAGTLVGPGRYTVWLTVTGDPATNPGESAACGLDFLVKGPIPILSCPAAVAAVLPGNDCQVPVPDIRSLVTVTYPCDEVTLSQDPASGTKVGVGQYQIKVTATGANGSQGTGFTVLTVTSTLSLSCPAPTFVPGAGSWLSPRRRGR